jgi:soluble lytic murein transglycosylase
MISRAQRCLTILLIAAIPSVTSAQDLNLRDSFAEAYRSYSSGSLAQAKELFQQTLEPEFSLVDYSLYYLALIAFQEGNFDAARQVLSQLRSRYPQSIWRYPAELQQAKIDLAEQKYTQASETLRSLRNANGVKSEIVDEAIFLQAQAQEGLGDLSRAHGLYLELRTRSPRSPWAAPARSALRRLREESPGQFGLNSTQAIADEADRLVRERAYGEAEAFYKRLLSTPSEPSFRLHILTKLADLYLAVRRRNDALPVLEKIVRDYPKTAETPKAIYQIGQILWNRHDNAQALGYFQQIIERYPTSPYLERARFAAADIHEWLGRKPEAISLYKNIMKSFPRSQVHDDAAARLAWLYYRDGEWAQAYAAFQVLAAHAKDNGSRTSGLYWQGRSAEKLGDMETAVRSYRQIVDGGAESYYQALALRALAKAGITVEAPPMSALPFALEAEPSLSGEIAYHLSRARELSEISLHRLAVAELGEVDRLSKRHPRLRPLLMQEYFNNQAYGRSLAIANELPSSHSGRNLYRFPLAYWEMIQQKAQERELDPYLILALIRQESLFDPRARSPAAALGLMQLLPSTAARVARQIGASPPAEEQLFEPETNLALGTQYLKDLLQRYSNDWFKAVAAYNAGEAAVDRWQREIVTEDPEEFIERIPYLETRGYVKLVMRNHRIYRLLYDQHK